jgi:hypothetical protein
VVDESPTAALSGTPQQSPAAVGGARESSERVHYTALAVKHGHSKKNTQEQNNKTKVFLSGKYFPECRPGDWLLVSVTPPEYFVPAPGQRVRLPGDPEADPPAIEAPVSADAVAVAAAPAPAPAPASSLAATRRSSVNSVGSADTHRSKETPASAHGPTPAHTPGGSLDSAISTAPSTVPSRAASVSGAPSAPDTARGRGGPRGSWMPPPPNLYEHTEHAVLVQVRPVYAHMMLLF